MTHEFHLEFTTLTCEVCKQTRFADEEQCGCEEPTLQFDPHVMRRRRLVWYAAPQAADESSRFQGFVPHADAWNDSSELLGQLLTALQAIAAGQSHGASQLRDALTGLRDMKAAVGASPRLRPWLAYWSALESALEQIELVASRYVEAFISGTAREAKRHAAAAQGALDEAATRVARYNELLDYWDLVSDDSPDPLDTLPSMVAAASRARGTESIVDLDAVGRALHKRVTGTDAYAPGIGLSLSVTDFVASVIYDRDSLWSKAAQTFEILNANPTRLVKLVEDVTWLADYKEALAEFQDAAIEAAALSTAATSERIEARATIRFGARLFEPIARPFLVPILAVGKSRPAHRLVGRKPKVTIDQVRQAGYSQLTEGLLAGIRDADAHKEYALSGDMVRFTSGRAERSQMTHGELLDSVLLGMETLHALHAGLTCALSSSGVALENLPDADAWDLTDEHKVRLAVGASGWTDVSVSAVDATMEVTGQGQFPKNPITLGGACLPGVPGEIEILILTARGEETIQTLEMVLEPFRHHYSIDDSWEREAAFLLGCALSTFESQPIYDQDHVRKWTAMKAGEALRGPHTRTRLKTLEDLAKRVDDSRLEESISAALRLHMTRSCGLAANPLDVQRLDLLIEWERRRIA